MTIMQQAGAPEAPPIPAGVDRRRPADAEPVAPDLAPPRAFDQACRMVVDFLADTVPLGAWLVTRTVGERQLVLVTADSAYGMEPGAEWEWDRSMCKQMVAGDAPRIIPDTAAVPSLLRSREMVEEMQISVGAYVGTPIVTADGQLFGTVIGLHPEPQDEGFVENEGLLDLLSSLLSSVLEADTTSVESARALERAVGDAETDSLTGLLNRRGWERWLAREEDRFRRFGDPACVLVMDLDGLKSINDADGHEAGDRYLRRFTEALRTATRVGDPLARLGGDEFAMVATVEPELAGPLVTRLQQVFDDAGTPCSVGVATVGVVSGFSEAVAEADAAMYDDKRQRRAWRRSAG